VRGPWATTYNRKLAQGHDHGSAACAADAAEKRAAANCPSTHCNRSDECHSPSDCSAKKTYGGDADAGR
jgi:hypothetical protein